MAFSVVIISPNGDGINDEWEIIDIEKYYCVVKIFNRWGTLIYSSPSKL